MPPARGKPTLDARLVQHIDGDDYEACRRLVERAPEVLEAVVTRDGLRATPLLWAAHTDASLAIHRLLLDHRADVNATADPTRRTALHVAVAKGHTALVDLLCAYGAAVDAYDQAGNAPLHAAVAQGDEATTRVLLEYGADVNQPDGAGRTPLHLGVSSRLELCQHLVAHRADVHAMDVDRFTPLDTALLDCSDEDPVVLFLLDEGAKTNRM